jgi:hypothetical protein
MKKNILVLFFISFCIIPSIYPQENITITTYYPAPMGVYENLRLFPTTVQPACDVNNEGVMYYNNNTNLLMVCRQTSTAPDTYGFQSAGSLWVQAGTTGPNGVDPIDIRPFDTNLKVGIGDVNVGWNRQNRLAVTDNTSTNGLGEQIALMEILNPRRGSSGTWSGGGDSVTALLLTPGGASWQVRADEFDSAAAQDSADAGAFMIHQTVNGSPATRLVIRNNGNVGMGVNNPRARLEVNDTLLLTPRATDPATTTEGTFYYNNSASVKGFRYYNGSIWKGFSGNAELYVRNAAGTAEKKGAPKILLGSFTPPGTDTWYTVSWTNTPFNNIYAVLLTPSDGGGYEFDAKTNGTNNSVMIRPDSSGMILTFLVIGD